MEYGNLRRALNRCCRDVRWKDSVVGYELHAAQNTHQIMDEIKKSLHPEQIQVTEGISLIAAVGRMMAYRPGVSGRLFAALGQNDVNVRMISQGPDEINIVFGVENKDFEKTIRILYNSFVRTDDA